jgi:hypothetical protein
MNELFTQRICRLSFDIPPGRKALSQVLDLCISRVAVILLRPSHRVRSAMRGSAEIARATWLGPFFYFIRSSGRWHSWINTMGSKIKSGCLVILNHGKDLFSDLVGGSITISGLRPAVQVTLLALSPRAVGKIISEMFLKHLRRSISVFRYSWASA